MRAGQWYRVKEIDSGYTYIGQLKLMYKSRKTFKFSVAESDHPRFAEQILRERKISKMTNRRSRFPEITVNSDGCIMIPIGFLFVPKMHSKNRPKRIKKVKNAKANKR